MNNLRGAKIIYQESKATQPSHLYFLQKDANYYDIIVTSESGAKRKFSLSNYYTKNETDLILENYYLKSETYSKNEVDDLLDDKQDVIAYTPENVSNKSDSYTASSSTTYASTKALVDGLDTKLDKGTYTGTAQDLKNDINNLEGKNIAQDDLINDLSSEIAYENVRNDSQDSRLENLEGINYIWSPTGRTLTLYDNNGNQLSQVSLVSLDNEGTDLRYNASTLSLELYNSDNELLDSIPVSSFIGSVGTQLQLNSNELQLRDSQGNILSTVSFTVSNIQGLQTALDSKEDISNKQNNLTADTTNTKYPTVTAVNSGLANKLDKGTYTGTASDLKNEIDSKANTSHTHDISNVTNLQTTLNNKLDKGTYTGTAQDLKNDIETKQKKLSSFDESILIETDGNIEGNVSLFTEYFNQQVSELNFIPTQIIGVYQDGIKLLPEEFNITLPKTITIKTYSTEKIEIQYTHLKNI